MGGREALWGALARPGPGPSRRFAEGRVCATDGCSTVISVYNGAPFCWRHDPVVLPRTFGHQGRRSSARRKQPAHREPAPARR